MERCLACRQPEPVQGQVRPFAKPHQDKPLGSHASHGIQKMDAAGPGGEISPFDQPGDHGAQIPVRSLLLAAGFSVLEQGKDRCSGLLFFKGAAYDGYLHSWCLPVPVFRALQLNGLS